jgi:pimeloyl-ACP methyl ester carboxylesterase
MNKNTYLLGIFFLTLSVAAGAFHSILLLRQEFSLIYLESYASWYLVFNIVSIAGHLFLLRYFHFKQWKITFITGIITLIMFVIQVFFQYMLLITVARELAPQYAMVAFASIISGIVFAATLVFSPARQNKTLKLIGGLMILHSVALLIVLFATNLGLPQVVTYRGLLWLTPLSAVFPLFYIFLFFKEMKSSSYTLKPSPTEEGSYYATGATGMIALVSLLTIGGQLGKESYWAVDWQKRGPEEARKLAERFEARIFINAQHDTLHYLLLKPLEYDTTKKYPMVTCLHGGPTRVAGNVEVTQPAPLLSEPANQKKYPAFLFVPQGRPGVLWGGIPGVPSMESLVFEAMDALEAEFRIDEDRRYVAGISGGGYGSWHFISTHPDRFAAAIPICGAGNPELAKQIVDVPVWAFHGDADRNVPVTGSRNMIEAIRSAGGKPKYNEFPGVGHNVWPEVNKTEGVFDWLFAQKRSQVANQ